MRTEGESHRSMQGGDGTCEVEGERSTPRRSDVQLSATYKQSVYKQPGWRGAPELSNGAGWPEAARASARKRAQAILACPLQAKKKLSNFAAL